MILAPHLELPGGGVIAEAAVALHRCGAVVAAAAVAYQLKQSAATAARLRKHRFLLQLLLPPPPARVMLFFGRQYECVIDEVRQEAPFGLLSRFLRVMHDSHAA